MTLTATYNDDLSRVQLAFTGASGPTDYALIERSIDGITWSTVRGGDKVAASAGAGHVDDYEFTAGVSNQYRATYIDTGLVPALVGTSTTATGNNASLTPATVTGVAVGNLKLVFATIRNQGVGVVGAAPTGWTELFRYQNMAVFGKFHVAGDAAPTITFTGGVANADTLASMCALSGSQLYPSPATIFNNASAQNINGPSITMVQGAMFALGWKQDDFTSTAGSVFGTKVADVVSTAGDDAGMSWWYLSVPNSNVGLSFNPFPLTVTGGAAAISTGVTIIWPSNLTTGTDTTTITPTLVGLDGQPAAWLKFPSRPSLNTRILVTGLSEFTRKARTGLFPVVGRTMPVAVTDLQTSRSFTIELLVKGDSEANDMDNRLSTGQPLFLQSPGGTYPMPTVYAVTGDVVQTRVSIGDDAITFTIPLTEVAAPGASVYGATNVWNDVVTNYATWSSLLSSVSSWDNLVNQVSNTTVIVT
jgi:hypothetical protein